MRGDLDNFINNLKPGMVYLLKDKEVSETVSHYFVVINKDIKTSPVLVLPVATSQVEKRKNYYERSGLNIQCLVIVKPEESNGILSKTTAFDCEQIKVREIQEIYQSYIKYIGTFSEEIVNKLRKGVKNAKSIEKWIKELV